MKLYKCVGHRITLKAEFEDRCAHICFKTQMIVSQCGSLPPALRHQAKLETILRWDYTSRGAKPVFMVLIHSALHRRHTALSFGTTYSQP